MPSMVSKFITFAKGMTVTGLLSSQNYQFDLKGLLKDGMLDLVQESHPKKTAAFLDMYFKDPIKTDEQKGTSQLEKGQLFVRNLSSKGLKINDGSTDVQLFSVAFRDLELDDDKSFVFGKILDGFTFLDGLEFLSQSAETSSTGGDISPKRTPQSFKVRRISKFNDMTVKLLQNKIMERVTHQIQMNMLKQQISEKESKMEKMAIESDQKDRDMSEFMLEIAQLCSEGTDTTNRDEITYNLTEKLQSLEDKNKQLNEFLSSKKQQNQNLTDKNTQIQTKYDKLKGKCNELSTKIKE